MSKQYTITKKMIKGIEINGFIVESDNGEEQKLSYKDVITLAKGGSVTNAEVIRYNEHMILCITNGMTNIPENEVDESSIFDIVSKIIDDSDKVVGYNIVDNKGKSYKVSSKKVWELAISGRARNISAKIYKNKKVLISEKEGFLDNLSKVS